MSFGLNKLIADSNRVVVYGCGTVADFIITSLPGKEFHVVAGLPEEIGKNFLGHEILDVKTFNYSKDDLVIVTSIGYRMYIEPYFLNCPSKIAWISEKKCSDIIFYSASF